LKFQTKTTTDLSVRRLQGKQPVIQAGPDLPIGYVGLSLGSQDPIGPPANCGSQRVNCRYM